MSQKFWRGVRVKVADELPRSMSHFSGAGCEAIVHHSYSDMYGTREDKQYSLLLLTEPPNCVAWYDESLLTLVSDNRDAGEELLQAYKSRQR